MLRVASVAVLIPFFTYNFLQAIITFENGFSTLDLSNKSSKLILYEAIEDFNGTLKLPSLGRSNTKTNIVSPSHKEIKLNHGTIHKNGMSSILTASLYAEPLEPSRSTISEISLQGNQHLHLAEDNLSQAINISGKNNKITGRPNLNQPLTLIDSDSELSLNIQNKLNQSVELNGGKLILENDLRMKDHTKFKGEGLVDIAGYTLFLPGSDKNYALTHNVTYLNANDIQLSGYTTLDGTWTFSGVGESSILNGNGNVLDISGGGMISIGEGHTLHMSSVNLRGLGANGGHLALHDTAEIKISTSLFELDGHFFQSAGKISIASPNCQLIIRSSDMWFLSGPSGVLEIDGTVFFYESVGTAPVFPQPIYALPGGSVNLLNGGEIDSIQFRLFKGYNHLPLSDLQGDNLLTGGVDMTSTTVVRAINENPAQAKSMTLNGNGFKVRFDVANPGSLIVDENVSLLIKNVIMEDLNFQKLTLEGSGETKASIKFGESCTLSLGEPTTIDTDFPWEFIGSSIIEGNNFNLTLDGSQVLQVGNDSTLTLRDMNLKINSPDSLKVLSENSKIVLENVTVHMVGSEMVFDQGHLESYLNVHLVDIGNTPGTAKFTFSSKGTITIKSGSTVKVGRNVIFSYSPDVSNDGGDPNLEKAHLQLEDNCSTIQFKNSTLETGPHGMTLTTGVLNVVEKMTVNIENTTGAEFEIDESLNLIVAAGAIMEVDGPLVYNSAT